MQHLLIILFFISLQGLMPVHRPVETLAVQDGSNIKKVDVFDSLVWSDEFDGSGTIDTSKWFQQTKSPPGGSWWGGLIQHYTDKKENAFIKDGFMHLVAKKETFTTQGETKEYTSVRLNSKFAFTYGKVEVRARLSEGKGTWPAIWMLSKNINEDGAYWQKQGFGTTDWPYCGEIDIMEYWGKNPDYVQSALHNGSSYGHKVKNVGGQTAVDASNQFHIYAVEWSADEIVFSVDGKVHLVYAPATKTDDNWPYASDYYLLMNIAIEPDISEDFSESAMLIDYVRVYQ